MLKAPKAILFDLDGTLADTAPDLARAINKMRSARGLSLIPYENLRVQASSGAPGLLGAGFGITPESAEYASLREEFLNNYAAEIAVETTLFKHIPELLEGIAALNLTWGIVTNKPARFTDALLDPINLSAAACAISGDTTTYAKPHPEPLFEAARRIGVACEDCWYIGDDKRDIVAGQAAGMHTIAAAWGYCGTIEPLNWQADLILECPSALLDLIRSSHAK